MSSEETDETLPIDTQGETDPRPQVSQALTLANYEIGVVIGRGGMGEVVAAKDLQIEREVAIKRMRADSISPESTARFLREAKIQARLDHPAIVPVHELGKDADGRPYFTMKRLAGTTLAERLAERRTIPNEVRHRREGQPLLRALVDVCFAIELAHSRGVVHRDLKPSNIMLGDYGEVYVLDWGIARVIDTGRGSASTLGIDSLRGETMAGALLGTPGYMAPEQVRGDDVGPAADIYALGAILFEILAGEPLHPAGKEALASTLSRATDSPAHRHPERGIAPELDVLCTAALADDPAARPRARELAERIQKYLDGDRDVEHRRALASEHLAAARAAVAAGDRAAAVRAGGRALVLDPRSTDAVDLVSSLIVEPPKQLPPALAESLEQSEIALNRERGRRGIWTYLAIFFYALFVPFLHVTSWPLIGSIFGVALVMAAIAWWNSRTGRVPVGVIMGLNFVLVVLFSRFASPFLLCPALAIGIGIALSARQWMLARRWLLLAWTLTALALPFVLEAVGVFSPTWRIVGHHLEVWGSVTRIEGTADALALVACNIALGGLIVLFGASAQFARLDAQRRVQIQAWHLRHLLPQEAARLP